MGALLKIAAENDLLEKLLARTESTLDRISEEFDFNTTYSLLVNLYGRTLTRLIGPNDKFCTIINHIPADTICIVIVGNAHIPKVKRKNSSVSLDVGMRSRLNEQDRTRKLFVTTITDSEKSLEGSYMVEENSYEYEPIENIRRIEDANAIFDYFGDNPPFENPQPPLAAAIEINLFEAIGEQAPSPVIANDDIDEREVEASNTDVESDSCCSFSRNC